jgi:hypothetical protein
MLNRDHKILSTSSPILGIDKLRLLTITGSCLEVAAPLINRVVHMNSKGNRSNPVFLSGVHGISSAMCTSWSGWIIIMKSPFTAAGRRQSFGKLRTGSEVVN